MRITGLVLLAFGMPLTVWGQFYPDSNAVWCGQADNGGPPGFYVQYQMAAMPDTTINGTVYKKVSEYTDETGDWVHVGTYYVRSDSSGRGYAYLPDSMAEYLTGDASALAGDTVHDVLLRTSHEPSSHELVDLVVDSVVTLTNLGVTVTRHYCPFGAPNSFWQAGMGGNFGPVIRVSGGLSICAVQDIVLYNGNYNDPVYGPLPGGSMWCPSINVGVQEPNEPLHSVALSSPNPSEGPFTILSARPLEEVLVYDPQGVLILRTTDSKFDLGANATGLYTAVVSTTVGRIALRIVVAR
jgi:hypothetical protein